MPPLDAFHHSLRSHYGIRRGLIFNDRNVENEQDGNLRPRRVPTYSLHYSIRIICPKLLNHLCKLVPRGGIEPPTLRFSVACSTN